MKSVFKSILSVILIGSFLTACGGDPNVESAKLNISRKDYNKALESSNMAIEQNPTNPLGYYYRGVSLMELASANPFDQREEMYRDSREAFQKSIEIFTETGNSNAKEAIQAELILQASWAEEYNAAIGLITREDPPATDQDYARSISHLKNSYAILPDSVYSIEVIAEVNIMKNDYSAAIPWYEMLINELNTHDASAYNRLAYLYNQTGNDEKTLTTLQIGIETYPDDIELVQSLADFYLVRGDTENALIVLEDLVDREPDNMQYRLVLGTQIYQIVESMSDDVRADYILIEENSRLLRTEERNARPNRARVAELRGLIASVQAKATDTENRINTLTDRAEIQIKKATELAPDDSRPHYVLGVIYQNRASAMFEKRNATDDNRMADEFNQKGREFLLTALPNYEKAAELEPDNTDYWLMLFRVYTSLGMNEKALEAQEKSGLN